jgi:hypothetical protein
MGNLQLRLFSLEHHSGTGVHMKARRRYLHLLRIEFVEARTGICCRYRHPGGDHLVNQDVERAAEDGDDASSIASETANSVIYGSFGRSL